MTGETILVVEDEGLIALHLIEQLEKAGYCVMDPVFSGDMALRALKKFPKPDLILMDIGLAGTLDGVETARQIRQQFSTPIIFVTAYSSEHMIERMREVAPEGIITKPFLFENLIACIRKAVDQRVI